MKQTIYNVVYALPYGCCCCCCWWCSGCLWNVSLGYVIVSWWINSYCCRLNLGKVFMYMKMFQKLCPYFRVKLLKLFYFPKDYISFEWLILIWVLIESAIAIFRPNAKWREIIVLTQTYTPVNVILQGL